MRWILRAVLLAGLLALSLWWMLVWPFAPARGGGAPGPAGASASSPRPGDDVEALLQGSVEARRLHAILELPGRAELPVARRTALLAGALEEEIASPAKDAALGGSYLPYTATVKTEIVGALARLGPEAIPALTGATPAKPGELRDWVICARLLAGDRSVLAEARKVLRSPGPDRRMVAARALAAAGDRDAVPELRRLLEDPFVATYEVHGELRRFQPVRGEASRALRRLGVQIETVEPGRHRVVEGK